jgi:hypothetical protein
MSEASGSPPRPAPAVAQSGVAIVATPDAANATAVSLAPTEPQPATDLAVAQSTQLSPPQPAASDGRLTARQFPDPTKVNVNWWVLAILVLAGAVVSSLLVAERTVFSHAHRLADAGAALLDVVALATLANVILLWYQSKISSGPLPDPGQQTLDFRQRGLKAAVIGQDGRASTSKTQVVLWTAAIVWALIYLLLLARAYPGGNLFTAAVTSNWRPEYLVLLGLPVAAAAAAKAVVSGSNNGLGPVSSSSLPAVPGQTIPVYVRDPVRPGVKGLLSGVSELITADNGTVAWADLQYVVFTLITLVYFAVQFLAQPQHGLPPVPAALLTLMGVSASGYTAAKIVETKGQGSRDFQLQSTEEYSPPPKYVSPKKRAPSPSHRAASPS